MATLLPRRIVGMLSSVLLALVALTGLSVLAAPAHAEDGYQYWNYFHLENDAWAFSQVGPADFTPEDGTLEAFRYGTSTPSQGIEPRADLAEVGFDAVCADTESATGEKRVAVLLDFGTDEGNGTPPEPRAECAVVDEAATTQQILDEVAEVRVEGGMTCALDGYPASGCGQPVPNAEIATSEEPVSFALPQDDSAAADETADSAADSTDAAAEDDDNQVWLLVGAGVLVVLLAIGALLLSRRGKTA